MSNNVFLKCNRLQHLACAFHKIIINLYLLIWIWVANPYNKILFTHQSTPTKGLVLRYSTGVKKICSWPCVNCLDQIAHRLGQQSRMLRQSHRSFSTGSCTLWRTTVSSAGGVVSDPPYRTLGGHPGTSGCPPKVHCLNVFSLDAHWCGRKWLPQPSPSTC